MNGLTIWFRNGLLRNIFVSAWELRFYTVISWVVMPSAHQCLKMVIILRTILIGILLLAVTRTADARPQGPSAPQHYGIAAIIPQGWKLQPPDANWRGKRFVSENGDAWLALYNAPADVSTAEHMKWVASAPGERTTYQRQGRSWIVVSGFKATVFTIALACGNRSWHHIAFEYPAEEKRAFDRLVTRTSHALKLHQAEGCPSTTAQR